MLAETMAEVKAGRMDPKVANTVAYAGTVLLLGMRPMRPTVRIRQPGHMVYKVFDWRQHFYVA
jgi:hypothetical protein